MQLRKDCYDKKWEKQNSPTTLASWSPMNFSKSASVLSSTEAGPACFFRKLTIPSWERKSSLRCNSTFFFWRITKQGCKVNTCTSGTIVRTRFLSISEDLQSWVPADAILAAYVAVGGAVDLDWRGGGGRGTKSLNGESIDKQKVQKVHPESR